MYILFILEMGMIKCVAEISHIKTIRMNFFRHLNLTKLETIPAQPYWGLDSFKNLFWRVLSESDIESYIFFRLCKSVSTKMEWCLRVSSLRFCRIRLICYGFYLAYQSYIE